jgi:succinate dehydrogenase/fumarate reductase-like Fe-S protein
VERLYALVLLTWALVRSLAAGLFGTRRGLKEFRESYAADRLPAITSEDRAKLPTMSGCIACGLCNLGEAARIGASHGAYAGAMDLALATSRSMPDFDAAVRSLDAVPDARLAELERRCPTRVPLRKIARFVRAKAADLAP